ncbi:cytochrome c biogenesis protein CcdC [Sphingomonas sp. LB-2]|uniref:cytochrome c biogenesis protein CcdC n=1 Tax=Sphingomonas caeni TaxID=2984949 RepID=UPI00222FDA86|nr:cytochrome c biogenesis protein CcdC [Sphingomonas caeni]MCW3848978.1 cytochrome c biogenesis protein CcdC [Sphingomonas caeni]
MNPSASPQGNLTGTVITLAIIGVVLFFRLRNVNRERPLKLGQLWIVPGIYAVVAGLLFYSMPPKGMAMAYCLAALAIGGALGWQRGRMMHISVDPATQTLKQKASLASMFFLLGLIALRTVARVEGSAWHFDVMLLTDILVALALGLLTMQRVEMYLRAKRLLEEARPT